MIPPLRPPPGRAPTFHSSHFSDQSPTMFQDIERPGSCTTTTGSTPSCPWPGCSSSTAAGARPLPRRRRRGPWPREGSWRGASCRTSFWFRRLLRRRLGAAICSCSVDGGRRSELDDDWIPFVSHWRFRSLERWDSSGIPSFGSARKIEGNPTPVMLKMWNWEESRAWGETPTLLIHL